MKKILKSATTFALVLAFALSCTIVAYAAEVPLANSTPVESPYSEPAADNVVAPCYDNYLQGVVVDTSWTTIATSTTGFNCNVKIRSAIAAISKVNIRMLDKKGNVVWVEYDSMGGNTERIYWCGSDVYTIQACTNTGIGGMYSYPTTESAD